MEQPLISILIPAYNEEENIENTLVTLKGQKTDIAYEVVVADNNSSDNTAKIAKKYADVVVTETNQGCAFARNACIRASSGKYIVHTDADTWFPDDFIDQIYPIFESGKYAGFTCGHWDYYDGTSPVVKILAKVHHYAYFVYAKLMDFRGVLVMPGWCICTTRENSEKVGNFREQNSFIEDILMSYKLETLGPRKYFPNIKVRSSLRRYETGILTTIKYYDKKGAGARDMLKYMFRSKKYDYSKK